MLIKKRATKVRLFLSIEKSTSFVAKLVNDRNKENRNENHLIYYLALGIIENL